MLERYRFIVFLLIAIGLSIGVTACLGEGTHEGSATSSSLTFNTAADLAVLQLMETHCDSCHGSSSPGFGGVSSTDDLQAMLDSGIVIAGDELTSTLFTEINSGDMPPSYDLDQDDIDTIQLWIQNLDDRMAAESEE